MKKHIGFLIKSAFFLFITAALLTCVNSVLLPKYTYDTSDWPTTSAYTGFYEQERGSLDTLFLGSSHAVSAFSPRYLYDNYGINSFNLGCDQQNMLLSYYWLREALKYQSPRTVVLETYLLFPYQTQEPLNSLEATTRKAMDYMRWSENKIRAVNDICRYDGNQTAVSYYFTNIRFHTRWTEITPYDFEFLSLGKNCTLKGYAAIDGECGIDGYSPFEADTAAREEPVPLMLEYFEKTVLLCRENNIRLILVSTPYTTASVGRFGTVSALAEKYGLEYYDFNEKTLYDEVKYNFSSDNADEAHAGVSGSIKLSDRIARVIIEK